MKTIFVLVEYGGEYDSSWHEIVTSSFDEEKLKTLREEHKKKQIGKLLRNRSYMEIETIAFED